MRYLLASLLLATVGIVAQGQDRRSAPEQTLTPAQLASRQELNETAIAYKNGKFLEAQRHAEMAQALDPESKIAPAFLARSIHAQYRPGINTPENQSIALAAIAAYRRILAADPANGEAYIAVGELYHQLGESELERQWWLELGANTTVPVPRRVYAYEKLVAENQICSSPGISDQGPPPSYVPAPPLKKRFQCAIDSLRFIDLALELDKTTFSLWSVRSGVLARLADLADQVGRTGDAAEYRRQQAEAEQRADDLQAKEKATPSSP